MLSGIQVSRAILRALWREMAGSGNVISHLNALVSQLPSRLLAQGAPFQVAQAVFAAGGLGVEFE